MLSWGKATRKKQKSPAFLILEDITPNCPNFLSSVLLQRNSETLPIIPAVNTLVLDKAIKGVQRGR